MMFHKTLTLFCQNNVSFLLGEDHTITSSTCPHAAVLSGAKLGSARQYNVNCHVDDTVENVVMYSITLQKGLFIAVNVIIYMSSC